MTSNQRGQVQMASRPVVNPEIIGASLRSAVEDFATQILIAVPHTARSASESGFLADCKRGRREMNEATMTRLYVIASRSNVPVLAPSDALLELSVRCAQSTPVCAFEASMSETVAQGPADQAAQLAAHEDTAVRWYQHAETLAVHIAQAMIARAASVRRALLLETRRAL